MAKILLKHGSEQAFSSDLHRRRCKSHTPHVAIPLASIRSGTSVAGHTDIVQSLAYQRKMLVETRSLAEKVGFARGEYRM